MSTCCIATDTSNFGKWQDDLKSSILKYLETVNLDNEGKWKRIVVNDVMKLFANALNIYDVSFDVSDDESSVNEKKSIDYIMDNEKDNDDTIDNIDNIDVNGVINEIKNGKIKTRELESKFGHSSAVTIRRRYIEDVTSKSLNNLPYTNYDYSIVNGACCENVIGFMPIPTGIAGPLLVNDEIMYIPLSTTEGALIASTSRGCRAVTESGGIKSFVIKDGMTRAPVVKFPTIVEAYKLKTWIEEEKNFIDLKNVFESTSRFAILNKITCDMEGVYIYIRFEASTGDAMGMNMVSKAVHAAMEYIQKLFPNMIIQSLSGNQCVDKKASAINWINGRGKSVISEAIIKADIVKNVLKTNVDSMVELAKSKLLIGTSTTMTIGGWNAHAANIVAALFLATGQDAAQVVSSSMCLTQMEKTLNGDLYISCTMKCIEVGTIGGGTILSPQKSCLNLLNCEGSNIQEPSSNSKKLAVIICSTVLAGELSLMAAQCSDDLVRSHLKLNRSNLALSHVSSLNVPHNLKNTLNREKRNNKNTPSECSSICSAVVHLDKTAKKFDLKCSNIL
ncbi:3-hydroxy-3-methylglutaryl-coenzyme A reductase [Strongyloides ratti]|uniref:3-hydroxy-3-methylglutaryl coenzyme A reductase n=1 Tax=Strongyloides ratti TaxID=34506 RepID=A0A090L106_STRRB|nr:3-hydroxy-3-methylglutaryl-coenzyme A reductase [Strongyloides ratti]CEF61782.1 3-hydroxy-3-methylglutaryl-coenzyme A reductase [Strongyloides ratti]